MFFALTACGFFKRQVEVIKFSNLWVKILIAFQRLLQKFCAFKSRKKRGLLNRMIFYSLSSRLISEKQYSELRNQNSGFRNRARGEKTKPNKVIEEIGDEPTAGSGAEIPSSKVPGAAARGTFALGFCDFAFFSIIRIRQI